MATPVVLVLRSPCEFEAGKREKVLDQWNQDVAAAGRERPVQLRGHRDQRRQGDFTITLKKGDPIKAEQIILSVGLQGNPNLMRCEGGNLPHVQYQLDDPGEYTDEHITVIGGGDAGIENALGLIADAGQNNTLTLLNRGADFPTAKKPNVDACWPPATPAGINVLTECNTALVEPGWITVDTPAGPVPLQVRPDHRPAWAPRRRAPSWKPPASSSPAPTARPFPS
jgi:hypothetical protein